MRCGSFIFLAALLMVSESSPSFAYCEDGQQPVPPEVAARMALPACGFAATKRFGPTGCQLCDPRNIYPNPFAGNDSSYAGRRLPYKQRATGTW
jgi:hypothetical protein